jgi:hypothetical protein
MIYGFNFTGERDMRLSQLMEKTLSKYCPNLGGFERTYTTGVKFQGHIEYGNGAGWGPSMFKLHALRELVAKYNPKDDDFVLSVDSDVLFCNSKVFDYTKPEYGIIGIGHQGTKANTFIGRLNHMSGCSIYIRGDIAKKMAAITEPKLDQIRQHFKMYYLAEQEDVVLSYLAQYCGAIPFSFPTKLHSGDFETDLQNGNLSSFYHLNYRPERFLGVKVSGKWDIPEVLSMKNIKL